VTRAEFEVRHQGGVVLLVLPLAGERELVFELGGVQAAELAEKLAHHARSVADDVVERAAMARAAYTERFGDGS
jgi:hypothetical protein